MGKAINTFKDAIVIITGGASGIGKALAEELAVRGSEVYIADLQEELAEKTASKIRAAGGKACAFKVDVTNYSELESIVDKVVTKTSRVDYFFNNAGIGIGGPVHLHSLEDWQHIVNTNLWGVINGVQAVYRIMKKQGFGYIINTSSTSGLLPSPGLVSYSTTKHAVVGLSIGLRAEAAIYGVRVSLLCPGVVRTPILEGGKFGRNLSGTTPQQQLEDFEKFKPMPADIFAKKVLNAVSKNKAIIVIPSWWKLLWWINRISSSWLIKISQKGYEKILKDSGISVK